MMTLRTVLATLLMVVIPLAAASAAAPPSDGEPNAKPRLILDLPSMQPGTTGWIGVHFVIRPGWHIYWNGINDTGFEPKVTWTLPEGYTIGELKWPAPKRYIAPGNILDHVYEDRVTLLALITVPATAKPGDMVEIKAAAEWLVCDEVCIPEEATISTRLTIGSSPEPGPDTALFQAAMARMPKPAPQTPGSGISIALEPSAKGAIATIKVKGARVLRFFPNRDGSDLENAIEDGEAEGAEMKVRLERPTPSPGKPAKRVTLNGVVEAVLADDSVSIWAVGPLTAPDVAEDAGTKPKP